MKKFLSIIVVALCVTHTAFAYDFESDGFYYNILSLSDLTVQVTCSDVENESENKTATYSGDITIPKTVDYSGRTFTVTSINKYAFTYRSFWG